MELMEVIQRRYSCRAYLDKEIEPQKMEQVLEAARLAPSAKNLQDWRFVIVRDKEKRAKLAHAANDQMFLANAAAIIVACTVNEDSMRCGQRIGPIDVSIALEHMALAATDAELATCWIGSFFPEKVRAVVGIPKHIEIVELMALGYPADGWRPPNREPMERIVSWEQWEF